MIILAGLIIGAVWGVLHVRKRGGAGADMALYGAVWGMIGAVLGFAVTLGIDRMFL